MDPLTRNGDDREHSHQQMEQLHIHSLCHQGSSLKRKRNIFQVSASSGDTQQLNSVCDGTSSKVQQLELARAKLEQLKKKHRDIKTKNSSGAGIPLLSDSDKTTKPSENVQIALKRAREKLEGAMQKRDRAMQELSPRNVTISTISALSANLVIENIAETGPQEKVFFPTTVLGGALGPNQGGTCTAEEPTSFEERSESLSLSERKLRLQLELQTLKEKLDQYQKENESCFTQGDRQSHIKHTLTKEVLEKKREEAQTIMDLSHWKHFVSKQENMLDEASRRVAENRRALMECEVEQQETESQLQDTHKDLIDLEKREKAVMKMLKSATYNLLRSRMDLYEKNGKNTEV